MTLLTARTIQRKLKMKRTKRKKPWESKSREALAVELAAERTAHERLRHEYELLQVDFRRVIDQMGNMLGGRPVTALELENDPYKEIDKLPSEWMTPGPEEVPDVRNLEDNMEPQPNAD